ncbi:MAG: hypothetical protein U0M05_03540 [Clostridia bacterium]|jgi:hypothetical protein|nr:hypothetical protein [Clostridia bacterium]UWD69746.1 MAG: XkdN-like tail assembly chaperone protein [Bacteriophage sp.]DAK65785.1 MAG TPA: tail assembly chaperone protein [Caudoviricetes sp.]
MSDLSRFLKKNKKLKENVQYAVTKSLTDEKGQPLLWEIRPLTSKETNRLTDECTFQEQVPGKPNVFRNKINSTKLLQKMMVASVVFPNLNDKDLQDSYGVMTPEELITEMVDDPGEYNNFGKYLNELNGFNEGINEKVEEAKN